MNGENSCKESKVKDEAVRCFYNLADNLEKYVDKKLSRFYITRKEYNEMKKAYIEELEKAEQRLRNAKAEREALINSALESKKTVSELAENARKLLELNSQLKDLLKENIEKKAKELRLLKERTGQEVVIKSMKKIRDEFGKKAKRKRTRKKGSKKKR